MVSKAFRSTGYFIEYLALIISIISVWTIMSNQGHLNTIILPAPNSILETIVELVADGALFTNMLISVSRVLQGYLLAAVLGITLGILIGLSKHLDRVTELIIQMIKPIPPIAWIPLVILWFGIGESGKVFLIFLGGFFTILINVVDGIHQTDPKLVEVSRSMETPFWKHISLMVIPGAAPNIFTGLRTGLSSCWMCVVA
ncbi:MAG: ABC transporter permease, partial [Anaerovibrio sp.]|nr:ABC transporter permease [Anaerovibrio sp.]